MMSTDQSKKETANKNLYGTSSLFFFSFFFRAINLLKNQRGTGIKWNGTRTNL
jgi:hypothetical protein